MADANIPTTVANAAGPQDYFLGADQEEQKNYKRKQLFQEIWQRTQYYFSLVWPYIYRFFSFIIYEILKVTKGIVHIAVSQIRQKD